jgi:hypothetical protein
MLRKTITLLALGLLLAPVAHAQTVDEILAKYFDACGGLDKLKALNSIRITGTMAVQPGMDAPFTREHKRPGKWRMEFTVQGMTGIQCFDGDKTWSLLPFLGKKDPEIGSDEDNKNAKDDADFDGSLVDYKTKGNTVELVGKEPVEGAEAYKLKITKKNGNIEYNYLDAETYLLVKTEAKRKVRGTEFDGETLYSDYKDVDGMMEPFSVEIGAKDSPQKRKMTFTKIELNVPLDDARFAVPAGATGGSPAAAAVTDSAKAAPKEGDAKAAATTDSTKKDAKGKTTKSSSKKKG